MKHAPPTQHSASETPTASKSRPALQTGSLVCIDSAHDPQTRIIDSPQLYRPFSAMNGNPFAGADGAQGLLNDTPITKHGVSFSPPSYSRLVPP
jgi:hypothetical protein